ncbi:hypothetical protein ACK8OR_14645 [Jannaschia sp. KMU-145]|uniref:hypothetical protein n=1 Tax=Jannaschia halovivens TaxID=3388667 RepID=UPI00396B0C65
MKLISMLAGAGLLLAGCVETDAGSDGFVRVTDEAAFRAAVVGRDLVAANGGNGNFFRLNADGSVSGNYGRGALQGSWSFEDGYWCRTWTAGLKPESLGSDCQLAELAPGQVALTRNRGEGNRGVFDIR